MLSMRSVSNDKWLETSISRAELVHYRLYHCGEGGVTELLLVCGVVGGGVVCSGV